MNGTLHSGHRKRIRQKILNNGIASFSDYEILEFLLFYTLPRRNTNELGHMLLNKFESLSALSQTSVDEICSIKGISYKSAAFIKYLPQLADHIFSVPSRTVLDSNSKAKEYCRQKFDGINTCAVKMCCLTSSLELMNTATVIDGSITDSSENMMMIISAIIANRCRDVILASNHLDSSLAPLHEELKAIKKITELFSSLDIRLADYIIVSSCGSVISLSEAGYLSNLKLITSK